MSDEKGCPHPESAILESRDTGRGTFLQLARPPFALTLGADHVCPFSQFRRMGISRLEDFSDGVIAIIIMVLEVKLPLNRNATRCS